MGTDGKTASVKKNKDAAEDLRATRDTFKKNVRNSMAGGSVRGISFERVLR
jgi:ubiquitin-conjugating enzyme E2 M